ncbi:MAG: MnhB domain-containing protein, partial [Verrucomicrobiota bacterium]
GYDTLLEVGVLLLALIAAWTVAPRSNEELERSPSPALQTIVRLVLPIIILGAGYFLWIGSYAPGGAFQAGAILGGGLVLLILAGSKRTAAICSNRQLLAFGLIVFLLIAIIPMMLGNRLLEFPEGTDKVLILVIETAATISIGLTLAALFLGAPMLRKPKLAT